MPEVELSAGTIDYEDTGGDGPVLVFLHGLIMDGSVWRHVVSELRSDYRCVVPTWPLGGHRRPMRPDADLSLQALGLLIGEFLERLDLTEVTLVQNDWGGAQVLLAHGGSDRLVSLVLTSCEAFDNYPPRPARPIVMFAKIPGGLALLMQALRLRAVRRAPAGWGWMSKQAVPTDVMDDWFHPATTDKRIRRDLAKYVTSVPHRQVLLDWAAAGAKFDNPVLVVWAREDRMMPSDHGRRLTELFPNAQLIEIDDSYTLIPEDQPARLVQEIREFLGRRTSCDRACALPASPEGSPVEVRGACMSEVAERYRRRADIFESKVAAVQPDEWGNQSPCQDWTARDVVGHIVDMHAVMLRPLDRELTPAPSVQDDPLAAFTSARADIEAVLDDPDAAARPCDTPMGSVTAENHIDGVVSEDMVIHGWDLARATEQDDTIDPYELERMWPAVQKIGPELRTPGAFGPGIVVFGPEVTVSADAPLQDRVLGLLGRDPG